MACIFFIDDDLSTLDLMGRATELLGHQAILSSTATDALTIAAREKPSLILVDLSLPDGDGFEVIRKLRANPATARFPVVVLSAGISAKVAENAMLAGADACLEKPLGLDALSRLIQKYNDH